jgi:hypothetical protein
MYGVYIPRLSLNLKSFLCVLCVSLRPLRLGCNLRQRTQRFSKRFAGFLHNKVVMSWFEFNAEGVG